MKVFSPAQLALILSLVESEKNELMGDIENPNSALAYPRFQPLKPDSGSLPNLSSY